MNKKFWLRNLLILILLLILADYFFLHVLLPRKKTELIESYTQEVNESLKSNPPPENANDLVVPKSAEPNCGEEQCKK